MEETTRRKLTLGWRAVDESAATEEDLTARAPQTGSDDAAATVRAATASHDT
jgi:hypothetical protein